MLAPAMEQVTGRGTTLGRARTEVGFVRSWPAVPDTVAHVRRAVVDHVRQRGATPAAPAAIELAVSEAVTNVVQHAYADLPRPGDVSACVESDDGCLLVSITDRGRGMRPRPDSPGLGLGLPLISQMTHSFEVRQPDGGGTVLCMRFDPQRGQL